MGVTIGVGVFPGVQGNREHRQDGRSTDAVLLIHEFDLQEYCALTFGYTRTVHSGFAHIRTPILPV